MSLTETPSQQIEPESMPENLQSVQPGGGVCYRIELAWGRWRRWYLKRFRPGYVARMASLRQGSTDGAPHEILDLRDLKYCRNRCRCDWADNDDPFRWRERLPFARWGLAELQLMGWPLLGLTVLAACSPVWYLAALPGVIFCLIVYFFRDPPRRVPQAPGLVVAPADGKVAEVTHLDHDEFVGGPAVRIGIFLSLFDVHVTRAPIAGRVLAKQRGGESYLAAFNKAAERRNVRCAMTLETAGGAHVDVVQITGLIARRIVCQPAVGEWLVRGVRYGMIRFGSRTDVVLPVGSELRVAIGDRVSGGSSVIALLAGDPA